MSEDPYKDTSAHERLMKELQRAVDEAQQTIAAARKVLEALSEHNHDSTSHPDIRTLLEQTGTATNEGVDERIKQHDENPNAHAELMAKLKSAMDDVSNVRALIDECILAHNTSETAHSDIREFMSEVRIQLGSNNLSQMSETLAALDAYVHGDVDTAILELQSVDAKHDSQLHQHATDIDTIYGRLDGLDADIFDISTGDFVRQEDLDRLNNQIKMQQLSSSLGLKTSDPDGPNMVNFKTTFPEYISKNSTINFTMSGGVAQNPTEKVKYEIQDIVGDFQISPMTNIREGDILTSITGTNLEPGQIVYFIVKATDPSTNAYVETMVGATVSKPMDTSRVSCYGLPQNLEPGNSYVFKIRNLADNKSGRYTYQIDPATTGFLFDKMDDLMVDEEITLTVPASADRDKDFTFDLVIHDKSADDQVKPVTVHTNSIPGAEDFETNLPAVVIPGGTYYVRFRGITSVDGTPANYEIENNNSFLEFSKSEGILTNENVKMTVAEDAPRGETLNFILRSIDNNGVKINLNEGVRVNTLPKADSVTTNLPTNTPGGQMIPFKITGGNDTESNGDLMYEIDAASSGFFFSKLTNISKSDTIYVTVPKVAADSLRSFNIYALDTHGEKSALPKQVDILVEPIWVPDDPYITSPQEGNLVDVEFTMRWSEYSAHTDMVRSPSEEVAAVLFAANK